MIVEIDGVMNHIVDAVDVAQVHQWVHFKKDQIAHRLCAFGQLMHAAGRQDQDLPCPHAVHLILQVIDGHAAVRHDDLHRGMHMRVVMAGRVRGPHADGRMLDIGDVLLLALQDTEAIGKLAVFPGRLHLLFFHLLFHLQN